MGTRGIAVFTYGGGGGGGEQILNDLYLLDTATKL